MSEKTEELENYKDVRSWPEWLAYNDKLQDIILKISESEHICPEARAAIFSTAIGIMVDNLVKSIERE